MSSAIDTGTGANRRRLTLEEAQRGDSPTGFTRAEWDAMHAATANYPGPAQWTFGNAVAYRDAWETALWGRR
jgi:hypothetical protein